MQCNCKKNRLSPFFINKVLSQYWSGYRHFGGHKRSLQDSEQNFGRRGLVDREEVIWERGLLLVSTPEVCFIFRIIVIIAIFSSNCHLLNSSQEEVASKKGGVAWKVVIFLLILFKISFQIQCRWRRRGKPEHFNR
jgi:hypothetical protein